MIGSFIKQKGTSLTGIVTKMGSFKLGRRTIPAYVAVTGHGCECVIPVAETEVIVKEEAPEKPEGELDGLLSRWAITDLEHLEAVLDLIGGLAYEYDQLSPDERETLPVWLSKEFVELKKVW